MCAVLCYAVLYARISARVCERNLVVEGAGDATHFEQLVLLQRRRKLQLIKVGVTAHLLQYPPPNAPTHTHTHNSAPRHLSIMRACPCRLQKWRFVGTVGVSRPCSACRPFIGVQGILRVECVSASCRCSMCVREGNSAACTYICMYTEVLSFV